MRDKETGCIFVGFLARKTEGKKAYVVYILRSSIKEARNHKYLTFTSLRHHSVSNLTNLFKNPEDGAFLLEIQHFLYFENPGILKYLGLHSSYRVLQASSSVSKG